MRNSDRLRLLHGPYRPPKVRSGQKLFCEIRGTVMVGGYTDAIIPWPRMKKGGRACLILCGDLVRAVRLEANQAIAHHFGISCSTVTKWRAALDVPAYNGGTRQVLRGWALGKDDDRLDRGRRNSKRPKALAKLSASLKGRVESPATIETVRRAAKRPRSEQWKKKIVELWRRRGHRPHNPNHRPWTPQEEALLGTDRDSAIAKKLGRSLKSVQMRRFEKKVAGYVLPVNGRRLEQLRRQLYLERSELGALAAVSTHTVHALETGRQKGLGTDKVRRLVAALGVSMSQLTVRNR